MKGETKPAFSINKEMLKFNKFIEDVKSVDIPMLLQGNLNTKYFHNVINWRMARNGINGLVNGGEWCEDPIRIKEKVKEYFMSRFS